jgi:hypothetical protein
MCLTGKDFAAEVNKSLQTPKPYAFFRIKGHALARLRNRKKGAFRTDSGGVEGEEKDKAR